MEPVQQVLVEPLPVKESGPVPMSFPAILRTPGLSDRFAHLRVRTQPSIPPPVSVSAKRNRRDEKEGKRWVRRKENARFVGNVHIVAPSNTDFAVPVPSSRATFPEPLPNYLSRNNPVPTAVPVAREPSSANAGRFSLSLKGMRRQLRNSGPRMETLVKELEDEIVAWLTAGGVMLSPDAGTTLEFPGTPVGSTDAVHEVSRTPLQLVWSVEDNAFTRYVVHCCARYHEVVSFSKDTSGQRLTYLLRPNVTRPAHYSSSTLDTPPVTDLSELSANDFDTESEPVSDHDASDVDVDAEPRPNARAVGLSSIVEVGSDVSAPPSPAIGAVYVAAAAAGAQSVSMLDDEWSVIGDSDADGDLSAPEGDLLGSVASLSLSDTNVDVADAEVGRTRLADARRRQGPDMLRSRLLERQRRSASSPSRSPARRQPARGRQPRSVRSRLAERRSFYDYLFA